MFNLERALLANRSNMGCKKTTTGLRLKQKGETERVQELIKWRNLGGNDRNPRGDHREAMCGSRLPASHSAPSKGRRRGYRHTPVAERRGQKQTEQTQSCKIGARHKRELDPQPFPRPRVAAPAPPPHRWLCSRPPRPFLTIPHQGLPDRAPAGERLVGDPLELEKRAAGWTPTPPPACVALRKAPGPNSAKD